MDMQSLHGVLRVAYETMSEKCEDMVQIGMGLAGLGALIYISVRIWGSIARAEPIDVYRLLRPFALGLCILLFKPVVLDGMNAILSPIVVETDRLVKDGRQELESLRVERNKARKEAKEKDRLPLPDAADVMKELGTVGVVPSTGASAVLFNMVDELTGNVVSNFFWKIFNEFLEFLYDAAGLIIDTIRSFFLIVLSILGPIVFGIAVWDGLGAGLAAWFSRYISIYLWLPVSSILMTFLSDIHSLMLQMEIQAYGTGVSSSVPESLLCLFYAMGIAGFFAVPTISGWIVEAGGGTGGYGSVLSAPVRSVTSLAGAATGGVVGATLGRTAGNVISNGGNPIGNAPSATDKVG